MHPLIDRRALKAEAREILRDAQVPPRAMAALYLALLLAMNLVDSVTGSGLLATFVMILITLISAVLEAGFVLYCMAVRRGERSEFLTLFDGFSFAGKVVLLYLLKTALIYLWSLLFVIPGLIAAYRYRFALYNLCENPDLSALEALNMSKRQTYGCKAQLLTLDLSYLGWSVLASLPPLFYSAAAYQLIFRRWRPCPGWSSTPPPGSPWWISSPCGAGRWSSACGSWRWPSSTCPTTSAWSWATSRPPRPSPAWARVPPGAASGTAPTTWAATDLPRRFPSKEYLQAPPGSCGPRGRLRVPFSDSPRRPHSRGNRSRTSGLRRRLSASRVDAAAPNAAWIRFPGTPAAAAVRHSVQDPPPPAKASAPSKSQ